jgi:MiaB-like tRNA modifying enzyme
MRNLGVESIAFIDDNLGKSVYVESYGCAANKADLEIMLAYIANSGYRISNNLEDADFILVNTCGVKKPTEDRMLERLRLLSALNKPLIVTGCLPKINFKLIIKVAPNFSAVLDPYSVDKIVLALKSAEKGEKNKVFFSEKPPVKVNEPHIRLSPVIEIIPISEGCLGACSFCCVRFARGSLFSYPINSIVDRLHRAVSEGIKEVWLTSQDNGAYGFDIGTNLTTLLKECCSIEGKFFIRVGMMNPNHTLKILSDLISIYKNRRIFKFLHLPVQSGDNEVLKMMNRRYTVEDFKRIVHLFRREIPKMTIATDVICGFPGESREAFERTLRLIEEIKPDIVNISKFFPRPKTPAERMKQVDAKEIVFRSRTITNVVNKISFERNASWLGWEGEILIDEKGSDNSWIGRNFAYKPIVVKSENNLLGKIINVRIIKTSKNYLEAKML